MPSPLPSTLRTAFPLRPSTRESSTRSEGGAAIGAAASASAYTYFAGQKATSLGVLGSAGAGALGGGLSTFTNAVFPASTATGLLGQMASGVGTSLVNQVVNSVTTGRAPAPLPVVVGSGLVFGAIGGFASGLTESVLGQGARSAIIPAGVTAFGQTSYEDQKGISPLDTSHLWIR